METEIHPEFYKWNRESYNSVYNVMLTLFM
jgi:hypothetical protein